MAFQTITLLLLSSGARSRGHSPSGGGNGGGGGSGGDDGVERGGECVDHREDDGDDGSCDYSGEAGISTLFPV